jgi:hypothetical protein
MVSQSAHRIVWRTDPPREQLTCWHCRRPIVGNRVARYLYRGERAGIAIVEDWHRCVCGAFANVCRARELVVHDLKR